MNHHLIQKTIGYCLVILFLGCQTAVGQHKFEIRVDSSEYLTDIPNETGRALKFLASNDKLVVLDYENYRILFY